MPAVTLIPPDWGNPVVFVRKGEKSGVLVIGFSGFHSHLFSTSLDFADLAEQFGYSRILMRDPGRACFMGGIDGIAPSIPQLVDYIRAEQARLAPERTMVIGNSGGGHSAILFGHLLGADYVHAFAPFTNFHPDYLDRYGRNHPEGEVFLQRILNLGPSVHPYCDLREVLAVWNGRTQYNVHFSDEDQLTLQQAHLLVGMPGVRLIGHPCQNHFLTVQLARTKKLANILDIDHQDDLLGHLA